MKVLVTFPSATGHDDPFLSLLPVGIGSLVAMLRSVGIRARAANLSGLSPAALRTLLTKERPDLLGISVMTHNRHAALALANLAKDVNPSCFVILGGPHATHRFRELFAASPHIDAIALGEGEDTLCDVAAALRQGNPPELGAINGLAHRAGRGVIVNPPRVPRADLDSFPQAWNGFEGGINIDLRTQLEFLITSRGCPAACTFCNSPLYWGRHIRFRSPGSMVDEIRSIRDRYGLIYFAIRDDTFTADRKRVMEFCRLLREERLYILWSCQSRVTAVDEEMLIQMRRAGCDCIQFGVESGSPAMLKALGKRITPEQIIKASEATRRTGIRLSIYLITGITGETDKELQETIGLLQQIRADDGQVSPLAYYPGTRLYDEAAARGMVDADLFERSTEEALLVRHDKFPASATKRLLSNIVSVAEASLPTRGDMAGIRRRIGYCHAGNVTLGEYLAERGDGKGAEEAFLEITFREPENPWGWLMLGEYFQETGQFQAALQAFENLVKLVPAHLPAWESLADLHRRTGEGASARRCRERIKSLAR